VQTRAVAAGALAALVDRELGARLDPYREAPLRLTIANEGGAGRLILTWSHPLMDPHGSEYLLRLLTELDEQQGGALAWPTAPLLVAPPDTRSLRERGALASRGAAQLRRLTPAPTLPLRHGSAVSRSSATWNAVAPRGRLQSDGGPLGSARLAY
jgi:hypothetical protein